MNYVPEARDHRISQSDRFIPFLSGFNMFGVSFVVFGFVFLIWSSNSPSQLRNLGQARQRFCRGHAEVSEGGAKQDPRSRFCRIELDGIRPCSLLSSIYMNGCLLFEEKINFLQNYHFHSLQSKCVFVKYSCLLTLGVSWALGLCLNHLSVFHSLWRVPGSYTRMSCFMCWVNN